MTPYNGLANRRKSTVTNADASTSQEPPGQLGVLLGAFAAEIAPDAPDLADVLTAWPTLPEPVKAGIVAMVKAAGPTGTEQTEGEK